jgi:hypothetical protein
MIPPSLSPRVVISISSRIVRLAAYVVAAAVVIVFALTRTEVGRDGLRMELERQFNRSVKGSLEIGTLRGNVFNRLSAEDVVVRDSAGREVISVERVVVRPTWRDVLRRTISTSRVTLVRPEVMLQQDEDGAWNVASALGRARQASGAEPWIYRASRIEIVDGHLRTRSDAPPPSSIRDGSLFDWRNADLVAVDARTLVDWEPSLRLVDVLEFEGRLDDADLDIDSLRGQLEFEGGRLSLNEVHLRTTSSAVQLNGSVSSIATLRTNPGRSEVELDLGSSTIDGRELARIVPCLVIDGSVITAARLHGPLNNLAIEELSAERGTSSFSLEGSVVGLPGSVDYDAALRSASIDWSDLEAVWPNAPAVPFGHLGVVQITGHSRGTLHVGETDAGLIWEGDHELSLRSEAGLLESSGHASVDREGAVSVDGVLELASVDVGRLLNRTGLSSSITGRVELQAGGPTVRGAAGKASIALSPSTWGGRGVDTLHADLIGNLAALRGDLYAVRGPGELRAGFTADLASLVPTYRLEARTVNLDLGPLLRNEGVSSSLNAHVLVSGRGRTWTGFRGDVSYRFDDSQLTVGSRLRVIPAHAARLSVQDAGDATPHVVLRGDVADVDVTGAGSLQSLALLARHWAGEAARSFAEELAKPYRPEERERLTRAASRASARGVLTANPAVAAEPSGPDLSGIDAQTVDLSVRVRRSDILSAFFPTLPALQTDLRMDGRATMAPDRIEVELQAEADSLSVGGVRLELLRGQLTAAAGVRPSLSRSMAGTLSLTASTVQAGEQTLTDPSVAVDYRDRGFDVAVQAASSGAAAPLRVSGRMDLLQDRNRLMIREFQTSAGDQVWTAPSGSIVDVFEEAVHVRGIRIERAGAADEAATDYLQIAGTLSGAPEDTLFLRAEDLRMQDVGSMIGAGNDLGGRLDGRLAFTGLNRRPELTGRLDIRPLRYRNRHLGRLSVTSRYIPGSPDVALSAALSPDVPEDSTLLMEPSTLSMEGTFRLPRFGAAAGVQDAGSLDLNVHAERADAFFFDYIFRDLVADVAGYITGSAHVGGDFRMPVFDARLAVREGRFRIPEFGLSYGVSGPVAVDRRGIHLDDLALTDAGDGRAVVGGSILFNEYRYFSFDLRAALEEVLIMNVQQSRDLPFYGRIAASGDVTLTGPLSNAELQSSNALTSPASDLYIPIAETGSATDAGFIVFADSTGLVPDFGRLIQRQNLLDRRPEGERPFLDGLSMDLDILAPEGSTVHLVIDPLLGDVINAVGSGRIQLARHQGEFSTFGTFTVTSGDYLFTAGEVFFRRFLIDSGTITWDGDPLDAMLSIAASYRTRASTEGLGLSNQEQRLIPLVIELDVTGRVTTPLVGLTLAIDRAERNAIGGFEGLEVVLNQPEQAAQYATSVLLTNSFLLTADQPLSQSRGQIAFNSVSQLVASQLNRYINYALPNVDLNLGVQGESAQDLDVTYGVALRMLDERLIIRGQGIYQTDEFRRREQAFLDEFIVEVRLNPRVSVEVFYRREGDILNAESLNTSTTGAGLSYRTEFSTWRRLVDRLFGWIDGAEEDPEPEPDVVAGSAE